MQMQSLAQIAASQASGLPPEKVRIHSQFMGGGFGRRGMTDFVSEAVEALSGVDLSGFPKHEIDIRGRVEKMTVRVVENAVDLPA